MTFIIQLVIFICIGVVCVYTGRIALDLISLSSWGRNKPSQPTSSFPRGWASRYVNFSDQEFLELDMDKLTTFWIEDGTDASFYEWYEKVCETRKNNKDVVPPNYSALQQADFGQLLQPGLANHLGQYQAGLQQDYLLRQHKERLLREAELRAGIVNFGQIPPS